MLTYRPTTPSVLGLKNFAFQDFLVVPTIRFQLLLVFFVLSHARRRVVHFNVTANPTAKWIEHLIVEALPWDAAYRYLLLDRNRIYGNRFR